MGRFWRAALSREQTASADRRAITSSGLIPTTGLADSFDPNASSLVNSIALQADGKILVGGTFIGANSIGGQTRNRIARLDPATGLADSFDPNADNAVSSIAVQADGKILAGGLFQNNRRTNAQSIARLDPTTGLADSFDPNASSSVNSIAVQPDGKILAGGGFTHFANGGAMYTQQHRPAGNRRPARPDAQSQRRRQQLYSRHRRPAGRQDSDRRQLYHSFGRDAQQHCTIEHGRTLDMAFNPNANNQVVSIAVQADGKILVGGYISTGRTASADRPATTSPGSMPRPAWLIRSTRTRTMLSVRLWSSRTARF